MNRYTVLDTQILKKEQKETKDGRIFEFLEIAYKDFSFLPGQFVMIRQETSSFQWAYPYMILKATAEGFLITAVPHSSLFSCPSGTEVAVWGANGRGIFLSSPAILICEAATAFLTAPFVHAFPDCKMLFYGTPSSSIKEFCPEDISYSSSTQDLLSDISLSEAPVIAALNYPLLKPLLESADDTLKSRITVFAATEIACGIGACRGCYLHSPDIKAGFPVCCEGPYISCTKINLSTDAKCFHYFI